TEVQTHGQFPATECELLVQFDPVRNDGPCLVVQGCRRTKPSRILNFAGLGTVVAQLCSKRPCNKTRMPWVAHGRWRWCNSQRCPRSRRLANCPSHVR